MMFTKLQMDVMPDAADLKPSTDQDLRRVQTLSAGNETDPGWRVGSPPPGFVLRGARRLGDSVQLLYSDGLASVSVYVEPVAGTAQTESRARRGAVNIHTRIGNGRRIVAIGK